MHGFKTLFHRPYFWVGRRFSERSAQWAYEKQRFTEVNERSIEYAFVFRAVRQCSPASVLDVGTGTTALPALLRTCGPVVTAIDNVRDYWTHGMFNRHYHVIDDNIIRPTLTDKVDLITCISVLEHIPDHCAAMTSMFRLLRLNGWLVLTVPYNESTYLQDVYRMEGAGYGKQFPYTCQVFSRHELNDWCSRCGATIIEQEYWRVFTGSYWTFGERLTPPELTDSRTPHHLGCFLFQKSGDIVAK